MQHYLLPNSKILLNIFTRAPRIKEDILHSFALKPEHHFPFFRESAFECGEDLQASS